MTPLASRDSAARPDQFTIESLAELERQFNRDAQRWMNQGSGLTGGQETGAAMAFSWLQNRARLAALSGPADPTEEEL